VVAVFFVTHMLGDPARLMLRPEASPEQVAAVRARLGLDDPLHTQFFRFLGNAARGDFGDSLWQRAPAMPIVLDRLPNTLYLAAATLLVAVPVAVGLGIASALRPGSWLDRGSTLAALSGVSIADFWLGLMLILIFAVNRGWFPTSGFGGPEYVVLPALALMVRPLGRVSQVVRSSMLDQLGQPYVTTARAKGLSERVVVSLHALKNAAIPALTLVGDETAALLNGAVVIETVFGWPGIGLLLIQAIERRDLPLIEASVFVIAVMIIVGNLLVDLAYTLFDPRIRYA
jgi:peptide/nickel transport system permease protein